MSSMIISGLLQVGTNLTGPALSSSLESNLSLEGDTIRFGAPRTPASAAAAGTAGEICYDNTYLYVCVDTNTWKRSLIGTWP